MGKIGAVLFVCIIIFICGCQTSAGIAKGVATGIGTTVGATAEGIARDTKNTANFITAADNWIKKNLW